MTNEEKFEGLKEQIAAENEAAYGREIRQRYGNEEVDAAYAGFKSLTREEFAEWETLDREILRLLVHLVRQGNSPEDPEGQRVADLHRRWLTLTGMAYDPARHRGIAELYIQDARFTAYYDKEERGCARFLRDAVHHWIR